MPSDDLRLCPHCRKRESRVYSKPVTDADELARVAEMLDEMGVPRGDAAGLWRVSYRLQHAQASWTDEVVRWLTT